MICYADFILEQETLENLGWAMICVVFLNIMTNFSFIIIKALKEAFLKLRMWYFKRKLDKLLKLAV